MKKLYLFIMTAAVAFTVASCSKDDNNSGNNNPGGNNPPPKLDVWKTAVGTYKGTATGTSGPNINDATIIITKINDQKLHIEPGPTNTMFTAMDIDVFVNDSAIYHQQGGFDGSFYLVASSKPPQVILTTNSPTRSYDGYKQ